MPGLGPPFTETRMPPSTLPPATKHDAAATLGAMTTAAQSAQSLVHALSALSESIPTNVAYTFLADGERDEVNLTFRELDWRARSIAARLQQMGQPGDRAALVFEPGLEYIAALLGCFYAGVVAVPIYPPDPMRMQRTLTRLHAVMDDAQAKFILTGRHEFSRFGAAVSGGGQLLLTDEVPVEEGSDWVDPSITGQTLAFLQYTSGSTGRPKGVMLTHSNLMFNFEHIKKFDELDGVAVSWLPMYHDMGLIGLVLQVLQSGRRTVLMSPLSFVKHPVRWLKAISHYRAYATSGPSFAYDLCVQKISDEERDELDLSCWTLAFNGAEPVRPDTLERFAERFGPVGFRAETFYPCYGLAEATLIVSGGEKSALPIVRTYDPELLTANRVQRVPASESSREIVGCGTSVEGQEVAIVDPTTLKRCTSDQVGEVWVRGPGVARGYWNNAQQTEETFNAFTSDTDEGPYLRTGDLGFLDDGELFVTGRQKDLIIIRGRNHYPQDLERTVEGCCPALRRDHGVAFGAEVNGEERLVIVQGVQRPQKLDLDQVMSDIRAALLHEHEAAPYAIVLVKGGEIPKTSSGKLQRRACKELYMNGELAIAAQWSQAAAGPTTEQAKKEVNACEPAAVASLNVKGDCQILSEVASIIRELKNGSTPANINAQSLFFADLSIESIDLVMLNEMVERRYDHQFPFFDFMAELGRKNQRDVSMGQFVEFISVNLTNGKQ